MSFDSTVKFPKGLVLDWILSETLLETQPAAQRHIFSSQLLVSSGLFEAM
jgi:hypothetical protein